MTHKQNQSIKSAEILAGTQTRIFHALYVLKTYPSSYNDRFKQPFILTE